MCVFNKPNIPHHAVLHCCWFTWLYSLFTLCLLFKSKHTYM